VELQPRTFFEMTVVRSNNMRVCVRARARARALVFAGKSTDFKLTIPVMHLSLAKQDKFNKALN
jgi:hypothetical protein